MNSASLETYHERMRDIQDVSETIAVANHQLNKLLQKFGWSRSHLRDGMKEGVVCSVDDEHVVKKDNIEKHNQKCFLNKLGINSLREKDIPTSSSSNYYAKSNTVVPVLLNEDHYKKAGVDFERLAIATTKSMATTVTNGSLQNNAVSLVEVDNAINSYIPTDALDELRFIYSWNHIPQNYVKIDSIQVSGQDLDSWIKEHIEERLQNEFYHMLIKKQCQSLDHPDISLELLQPVLGEDARQFVLNLWKFVAAKSLCRKQNISEHTRKEFDVYGMSSVAEQICSTDNKALGVQNASVLSQLPTEWSYYNLTREQKLKIYEEVCEIRKRLSVPALQFTELQADAEEQMKVLTSLEAKSGEKTKLEIMAEMRDYKRRRQSYRGKNKSNAKLTAIEVLREIVEQQMLYLDIVNGRNPSENADAKPGNERKEKSRSPERRRRSRSREKDRQRGRDRSKDRRRSRSRERKHRNRSRERRRNRSRSNDRKDRRYRRSSSREKDNRVVNDRRKKFTETNPQESTRKRESKGNQYRDRSPYVRRNSDREICKPKEISNITYYDVD